MKNYYFTFGSDPGFPYQNTYLIVKACSRQDAIDTFRSHHPDRNAGVLNCAFWYTEEQWHGSENEAHYPKEPAEVIESSRPSAHWNYSPEIARYTHPYECSHCGRKYDDATNFCPNCGAKMNNENQEGDLQ